MSTSLSTITYIEDQLAGAGVVRSRKMFGEYALYCDGKVVALVCDDHLYIKPTSISEKYLDSSNLAPPYPGARSYCLVPDERLEDREWLAAWIRETAVELPLPKEKKARLNKKV